MRNSFPQIQGAGAAFPLKHFSWAVAVAAIIGITVWVQAQVQLKVGYTELTADSGSRIPAGSALFTFINSAGVLVSQAGVGAAEPTRSIRIFVDEAGTKTGLALVNPSTQSAIVALVLRDASGNQVSRRNLQLGGRQHLPNFVQELFPDTPAGFVGSLTADSDQVLAAVTLRESRNRYGEPLYSTLPVADLTAPETSEAAVFPHLAVGEGYSTQMVLINRSNLRVRGRIRFTGSDGQPLLLRLSGSGMTEIAYEIDPQGTYRAELDSVSGLKVGYAVMTPEAGSSTPAGTAIFRYKVQGELVTEAGAATTPVTTVARIFVDNAATRTGIAVANSSSGTAELRLTLMGRSGTVEGVTMQRLPAGGHLAIFAHELFPGLADGFTGLLEIQSTVAIAPVTLKVTTNSRNDLVLTTLPVADMTRTSSATRVLFPQIAIGSGFSTRLVLISRETASGSNGRLNFYQSDGSSMVIPMGGATGSEFSYHLAGGGGRQFLPGNGALPANIALLDPLSNRVTTEVVVNESNRVRPRFRILDTAGQLRDDFDPGYTSINQAVATVDEEGNIRGASAGFSTLIMTAGGVVAAATITVVGIDSGVTGFETTGVVQDLARRLYLASTPEHTILLAQDLSKAPAVYAGIPRSAGLRNDLRLQSLFRNPAFLAFNQAEGSLYVSDGANHVIRRIRPGSTGRVETLAGTGALGNRDGAAAGATFNNPQGVALDNRGNLWVADSDNHTIRRIQLNTGMVETIAGKAGTAGFADGARDAALFRSPVGIAVETESTAAQLDRERRGDPPPPVRVIVADAGNGAIRRVQEDGAVETIGAGASSLLGEEPGKGYAASATPAVFNAPAGVGVDQSGVIYVSEPNSGQVKAILPNGDIVSAAQPNTFRVPRGIAVAEGSRLVVADSGRAAQQIRYGEPQIASITPGRVHNQGGDKVIVKGSNFAPGTVVIAGGVLLRDAEIRDTQTIVFTAPSLPSGLVTVTVHNRGGLVQKPLLVEAVTLADTPAGYVTTVAGGTTFVGDGAAATSVTIASPVGVAVDSAGNLFISDQENSRIRKVSAATGIITSIAGTGENGFSGDGGPAAAAQLNRPNGIAVDAGGNLFIADIDNQRIRRVDAATGIITTAAGSGAGPPGLTGDNGPAKAARLTLPYAVAVDAAGNLFIADFGTHRIRRVDAATGIITTVAGKGTPGFSGDGGPAIDAQFFYPVGIAIDPGGNLFVADLNNQRIRKISTASGIITTVAGTGARAVSSENIPATGAALADPPGVAIDTAGNLFIADAGSGRVRRVDVTTGIITTVANADYPSAIVLDAGDNLFIADRFGYRIRRVNGATRAITTVAGAGLRIPSGDNAPATAAQFLLPRGIAVDRADNLLVADKNDHRIRKVDTKADIITTVAGSGILGSVIDPCCKGENGLATAARLTYPPAVTLDGAGNIFLVDNHNVRRVDDATGIITTIAGVVTVNPGFSGDTGPAAAARLNFPEGITVNASGNLLIADTGNNRIRRVDTMGIITTVAGSGGVGSIDAGFSGDGGAATSARLAQPFGLAVDAGGNLFIADTFNNRIRRVDAAGIITTVAGTGAAGFSGDGGPATSARLNGPQGIALDASSNLLIADTVNNRIRRVDLRSGTITTVAGGGIFGFSGDNGPALSAQFRRPTAIAIDSSGNLFISDTENHRIRAVRGAAPPGQQAGIRP